MPQINIKAMSINEAYNGVRTKSKAYRLYSNAVLWQLRPLEVPEGHLKITICFGVSYAGMDIDNGVKPFIDLLQKRYKFNDNRIYKLDLTKEKVPKGEEFISFEIERCEDEE